MLRVHFCGRRHARTFPPMRKKNKQKTKNSPCSSFFFNVFLVHFRCSLFPITAHYIAVERCLCCITQPPWRLLQMPRMESAGIVRGWDAFRRCDMTRSIKKDELRFSLFCAFSVFVLFRVWSLRLFAVTTSRRL